jgi:hypothetical protein
MAEPHYYVCRACGRDIVECIPTCPCVESHLCEECVEDERPPIVKIEGSVDPWCAVPEA